MQVWLVGLEGWGVVEVQVGFVQFGFVQVGFVEVGLRVLGVGVGVPGVAEVAALRAEVGALGCGAVPDSGLRRPGPTR